MITLIETARPYINHYGYWAVFSCVFLESLGLPLPGETFIVVAGLYAAKGTLNLTAVIFFTVIATFAASNISYIIGCFCGRRFVVQYGKYIFINERMILAFEDFVKRHGSKVIIVARFIMGLRQLNGYMMGTVRMPWWKFTLFNMIGAILWAGWWIGITYYIVKKFDGLFIKYFFLIGLAVSTFFIVMAYRFFKKYIEINFQKLK